MPRTSRGNHAYVVTEKAVMKSPSPPNIRNATRQIPAVMSRMRIVRTGLAYIETFMIVRVTFTELSTRSGGTFGFDSIASRAMAVKSTFVAIAIDETTEITTKIRSGTTMSGRLTIDSNVGPGFEKTPMMRSKVFGF